LADYIIAAGNGFLIVAGPDGTDTLYSINRLAFDDQTIDVSVPGLLLTGGSGDDVLVGNEGNDSIDGQAGNDTLTGNDGDDWLYGGEGNDQVDGGSGNDTIVAGHGEGDDAYVGG